ncbi:hypothetical protein ACQHGV_13560 [Sphingomonas pseudosanguinis]|uniref:hypothetical protein n=1 Tax=Sphingomonas pseudosanguinis TaxID=413712 RepID=UPI003F866FB1
MACSSCLHFLEGAAAASEVDPAATFEVVALARVAPGQGICRRYPPRWVPDLDKQDTMSVFPYVHRDQECGEFNSRMPL